MNTQKHDTDWNDVAEDYDLTEDFEVGALELSSSDSNDMLYETEAANEDLWRIVDSMDGEWEVAAAEGFPVH